MFIPREYQVCLPIHDTMPADDQPKFTFRASSWAERQDIIESGEDWEKAEDERQIIDKILPLVKRHLVKAPFTGEIEQELEYVQIVELYSRMKIADQLSALAKKNYVSPSPSDGDSSTH
jgi:hypothetical protein